MFGGGNNFDGSWKMLKLVVGAFAALVFAVLGHASLVHSSTTGTGAAEAAKSTCAWCHG